MLLAFAWVPFRSTKAAIKLHTLVDLKGPIPTFIQALPETLDAPPSNG